MLCVIRCTCGSSGLGAPTDLMLPMTQEQIADATGFTAVHVNRVLRTLSEEGLLNRGPRRRSASSIGLACSASAAFRLYPHLAA